MDTHIWSFHIQGHNIRDRQQYLLDYGLLTLPLLKVGSLVKKGRLLPCHLGQAILRRSLLVLRVSYFSVCFVIFQCTYFIKLKIELFFRVSNLIDNL